MKKEDQHLLLWIRKLVGICFRVIRTLVYYPKCIYEMYRCLGSPYYINSFSAHTTAVRAYLYTHGISECIERFIFGPRYWHRLPMPHGRANWPELLIQLSETGYARLNEVFLVDDLLLDLITLRFMGRVAGDCITLAEMQSRFLEHHGRYDAEDSQLMSLRSFANLVVSEPIYKIASTILGSGCRVTSALIWGSFPCLNETQAIASAQVFHIDYDYLDDLKLFINLSSVKNESGALEYVAGTHRPSGKKIWTASPISERLVWKAHSRSSRVLFTGIRGSAYVSDNRGLHRDSPPAKGHWKLAMQVNFSRNQFGSEEYYAPNRPMLREDWPSSDIWKEAIAKRPNTYDLLFSRHIAHANS